MDNEPLSTELNSKDQRPFVEQFIRCQQRVFSFIITLLPNRIDADDAFQQTCLILWSKWEEFDPNRDFTSWACGIAMNVVRNQRRARSNHPVLLDDASLESLAEARQRLNREPSDRSEALSLCVEKLSLEEQRLIAKAYGSSETIQSISQSLSKTPAALYVKLQRIRQKLYECVQRRLASTLNTENNLGNGSASSGGLDLGEL